MTSAPPVPAPSRAWRTCLRWTGAALAAAALIAAGAWGASLRHRPVEDVAWRNLVLEVENAGLRSELRAFEERLEHLSGTLEGVERRDAELRQALGGLDAGQPPTSPAGGESQQTVLASAASGTVAKLTAEADRQAAALEEITHYFEAQRRELARSPAAWPARGLVTSDFGARLDPYTADRVLHRGLDIAGPAGGPVLAPSERHGHLRREQDRLRQEGVIDHGLGIETTYSHLARIEVKRGRRCSAASASARWAAPAAPPVRTCTTRSAWTARR